MLQEFQSAGRIRYVKTPEMCPENTLVRNEPTEMRAQNVAMNLCTVDDGMSIMRYSLRGWVVNVFHHHIIRQHH
jgi:hypothetical protein